MTGEVSDQQREQQSEPSHLTFLYKVYQLSVSRVSLMVGGYVSSI